MFQFIWRLYIPSKTIVRGDSKSLSIAGASIFAKIKRDELMKKLAVDYPHYGWDSNFGYGTKQHIEAISKFGITPHHRKSYKPIKKYITE